MAKHFLLMVVEILIAPQKGEYDKHHHNQSSCGWHL